MLGCDDWRCEGTCQRFCQMSDPAFSHVENSGSATVHVAKYLMWPCVTFRNLLEFTIVSCSTPETHAGGPPILSYSLFCVSTTLWSVNSFKSNRLSTHQSILCDAHFYFHFENSLLFIRYPPMNPLFESTVAGFFQPKHNSTTFSLFARVAESTVT
jgi:hypothetical protein